MSFASQSHWYNVAASFQLNVVYFGALGLTAFSKVLGVSHWRVCNALVYPQVLPLKAMFLIFAPMNVYTLVLILMSFACCGLSTLARLLRKHGTR